ncbi:MAG: helix-turn-helix domain-containing protein [Enterococcus hulanensis]
MDVMVLTRNIKNDEIVIEKLRELNYGYYYSSDFANLLVQHEQIVDFARYFKVCLLSNTLSNHEVENIALALTKHCIIFRLYENEDMESVKSSNLKKICIKSGLENFREELSQAELLMKNKKNSLIIENRKYDELTNLKISKSGMKLVKLFIENKGKVLSRREIVEQMWGETTPSRFSQISFLVNSIKKKIQEEGIDCEIESRWGKGYILK